MACLHLRLRLSAVRVSCLRMQTICLPWHARCRKSFRCRCIHTHAKSLRACAPEGVTCQIKAGAKHLVAIPKSRDGISNRTTALNVLAGSLRLVSAHRIRQSLPAILPCCSSEALAEVELIRAPLRSFWFLLLPDFGITVAAFGSVEIRSSAPAK